MPISKDTAGLRNIFATNLRRFTNMKGSVALVCRETGINRQQFNRYLAGQSLPGVRVLKILVVYFNKSESQLFEVFEIETIEISSDLNKFTKKFQDKYQYNLSSMILEGYHYTYFVSRNDADNFYRGMIKVIRFDNNLTFTLYVTNRNFQYRSPYVRHERYDGFVTETSSVASFFGMSKSLVGSTSLMLAKRIFSDEPRLLAGLSLASHPEGPLCFRFMMEHVRDPLQLSSMMRSCGLFSLLTEKLDPTVRDFLKSDAKNDSF